MNKLQPIHSAFHQVASAIADAHKYGITNEEYAVIQKEIHDTQEFLNYLISYDKRNQPEPEVEEDFDRKDPLIDDIFQSLHNIVEETLRYEAKEDSPFRPTDSKEFIERVKKTAKMTGDTNTKELADSVRIFDNLLQQLLK